MKNDRFKFRIFIKSNDRLQSGMVYNAEKTYDSLYGVLSERSFGDVLEKEGEDYEIMQSTGFKDKNGKLIYEGDIVKGWIRYVRYDGVEVEINYKNHIIEDDFYKDAKYYPSYDLEIIGNIYENKDLMKE